MRDLPGPDTEIFFDRGEAFDPENIGIRLLAEDIEKRPLYRDLGTSFCHNLMQIQLFLVANKGNCHTRTLTWALVWRLVNVIQGAKDQL